MVQISPALLGRVVWARKFRPCLSFLLFASNARRSGLGVVLRYDNIMKRARVVAGVMCAIAVVTVLFGQADAERLRRGPADPAHPHITAASQYDPANTISGAVRADRRVTRCGFPEGRGCLAASIAISRSE